MWFFVLMWFVTLSCMWLMLYWPVAWVVALMFAVPVVMGGLRMWWIYYQATRPEGGRWHERVGPLRITKADGRVYYHGGQRQGICLDDVVEIVELDGFGRRIKR